MRIRTKLLLAYVALIGLVAVLTGILLRGWVEGSVIRAERSRLKRQAESYAQLITQRSRARGPGGAVGQAFFSADLLVDDSLLIVDSACVVVRSTRRDLEGRQPNREVCDQLNRAPLQDVQMERLVNLQGVGPVVMESALIENMPGWRIVMLREADYIRRLAQPITMRLFLVVGLVLLAAFLVSAWLSRDLVRRLASTGAAARALSEGDLSQRAPELGKDEITELAGHFNHMAERLQVLVEGLRRSERLRRELLVTVSHELRTPLTSITGFAEALRDGVVKEDSHRQRYYEIIASEASRLRRLIADVFDMAKLEAGQVELRLQAMPVASWLVECLEGFEPMAEGAGIRLELEVSPEAERARVYGDRDRLGQVMANLLGNAVRFSPRGQSITVRARVEGSNLITEVSDRGPGLQPGEEERVFERFYQGSSYPAGHKGAGLGLAIVKSLIEAHAGTVGVYSTPGHGATFWFRLKRAE